MKKFFITLMCIVMVVCFMPTVAMADVVENCSDANCAHVAAIGTTHYGTLQEAIEAVGEDGTETTIKLVGNITGISTVRIDEGKAIILDLNGHTIKAEVRPDNASKHYYAIDNYGQFTLKDTSIEQTGSITARGIENLGDGVMTIESGKIIAQDSNGGACIWNEATLFVNGGNFETIHVGSSSDGVGVGCLNNSGSAVITAGEFESVNKRTYAIISTGDIEITPAEGKTVNVAGAHGGLGIDAGTAVVNGGTYTSTDYYGLYVSNDGVGTDPMTAAVTVNGGTFSGANYSVWIGSDYNNPVNSTIRINDGEFQKPLNAQENTREGAIVVAGGTFSSDVSQYVPEGTKVVEKDGIFTLEPADNAVAQVGDAGFTTLQAAIAAATDGQTVKLLDNVGPITKILYINKNLTLDLGGKTLTTNDYYSFIVNPGISFTLQNGTLKKNTIGIGIAALKSSTITVAKDAKIETAGSALFGSNNEADEGHVTFNVYGTLDCEYIGIWGQGPNNTFNVDGATITSKYFGVYQNGSFGGCKINIKNSTITDEAVDGTAVYISNNKWNAEDPKQGMQELTIENSIITGATAVEAKYTNINIKGSKTIITATGEPADTTLNDNGPVTTGYAIAVTHNGALKEDGSIKSADSACGKITIEGGTFNGLIGIQEPIEGVTTEAEISVSGGKFTPAVNNDYLAPGVVQDSKGNVYKPYYGGSIPTDSLKTARTEAIKAVTDYVNPADYEEAQQAEIKTIVDNAKKDIEAAKTADEIKAIEAAAKAELDKLETAEEMSLIRAIGETKFVARSKAVTLKNGKKAIKITWYDKNGKEVKFDGVEIFRSTKRYSGYGKEPIYVSKSGVYYNTAIEAGTKYYYKVRGYVLVNGEKVYTDYSTKAWRTA